MCLESSRWWRHWYGSKIRESSDNIWKRMQTAANTQLIHATTICHDYHILLWWYIFANLFFVYIVTRMWWSISLSYKAHYERATYWRIICMASRLWVYNLYIRYCIILLSQAISNCSVFQHFSINYNVLPLILYSYWYDNGCLLPDLLTVFIAVDKADVGNGCLKVYSNSYIICIYVLIV